MLPANVTIFLLKLTRTESPILATTDNSSGSTIREIFLLLDLTRHARFFCAGSIFPSTKSLLPRHVRGANIAFCSGRTSLWEFKI